MPRADVDASSAAVDGNTNADAGSSALWASVASCSSQWQGDVANTQIATSNKDARSYNETTGNTCIFLKPCKSIAKLIVYLR